MFLVSFLKYKLKPQTDKLNISYSRFEGAEGANEEGAEPRTGVKGVGGVREKEKQNANANGKLARRLAAIIRILRI